MKHILVCLTLLLAGAAGAADQPAPQASPEALQKTTRLATAGNAEAQQRLGEMYLSGAAGAVDEAKAQEWFRKAAAKGNKEAAAALARIGQRAARRADIDYWMSKYDGADLKSGEYRCPAPRIPAISKQNEDIDRVSEAVRAWQDCYNRYVVHMNEASPLTKRIPADVAALMTKDETARATAYLAQVHANLAEDARVSAKLVLADFAAWRGATEAWVREHNEMVKNAPSPDRQRDIEARRNNYGQ